MSKRLFTALEAPAEDLHMYEQLRRPIGEYIKNEEYQNERLEQKPEHEPAKQNLPWLHSVREISRS
ncbi:hypothetical protein D3C78_837760 [compost metagenome]